MRIPQGCRSVPIARPVTVTSIPFTLFSRTYSVCDIAGFTVVCHDSHNSRLVSHFTDGAWRNRSLTVFAGFAIRRYPVSD